jgi:hypothetical protein
LEDRFARTDVYFVAGGVGVDGSREATNPITKVSKRRAGPSTQDARPGPRHDAVARRGQAVEGRVGRDATDPRILLSVWLLAFAEGHGSARGVARLGQRDRTTDADTRTMKFPDGGFRPGYNVQFTTDTPSGLIVGVDVTNQGTDAGLMDPMLEQVEERTGQVPDEHLTDGGFATVDDIENVTARGTTVFTPVKDVDKKKVAGVDPFQPQPKDSEAIGAWRQRMGTEEAKETYKLRAQTAEWTNAQARNRNFYRVRVRGLAKVQMIALWYALIHNVLVAQRLRAQRAAAAAAAALPPAKV